MSSTPAFLDAGLLEGQAHGEALMRGRVALAVFLVGTNGDIAKHPCSVLQRRSDSTVRMAAASTAACTSASAATAGSCCTA